MIATVLKGTCSKDSDPFMFNSLSSINSVLIKYFILLRQKEKTVEFYMGVKEHIIIENCYVHYLWYIQVSLVGGRKKWSAMDLDDLGSTKVGSDMDVVVTSWNLLKWNSMLIGLMIVCIVLKPLFQAVLFSSESISHCSLKFSGV